MKWLHAVALALVLCLGAGLRFTHLNWDGGNQLHPDERAVAFAAGDLAYSPNPFRAPSGEARTYPYGHFPLYCMAIAQRILSLQATSLIYIGRALSALSDTLTILATYLLARQLYDRWSGLLAATFVTLAVIHIQNAHFGTVDTTLTLFATLSVWLLARYADVGRRRDTVIAGFCAGLAIGSKATGALLIVPILAAHLTLKTHQQRAIELKDGAAFRTILLAAAATFVITNPFSIIDPVPFVTSLVTQAGVTSGRYDWPFTRQFSDTLPVLYHAEQQARWYLGLPLTLAGYCGLARTTHRIFKVPDRKYFVALAWVWASLLAVGVQYTKFPRYLLPMTPALLTMGSGMLMSLRQWRFAAVITVIVGSVFWTVAFMRMYDSPHPWMTASEWIYQTVPPGTVIAVEQWDDPLPLDLEIEGVGHLREQVYETRTLDPLSEPDDVEKLRTMLAGVAESDYLLLSSNRLYGVIPRLEVRYPLTGGYYRALFKGELGFTLEAYFNRTPRIGEIAMIDDPFAWPRLPNPGVMYPGRVLSFGRADESFAVYDHPLVLIFRNGRQLRVDQMLEVVLAEANSH